MSFLFTIIAIAQFANGASAARILAFVCLAQFALLVATFWSFHKAQTESRRRESEIPQLMEQLLADGLEALDRMVAAQKADPQRLGPWAEQIDEVGEFFNRARQLLIDHNKRSLLDDLGEYTNEARRRELERQNRPFAKLKEREDAGEIITNAEKMELWGDSLRRRLIGEMEATLTAVSKVAKQLA